MESGRFKKRIPALAVVMAMVGSTATVSMWAWMGSAQAADGPAWTCSEYGYLFQTPDEENSIHQVDLVSGASSQIGLTANNVNAVGYNTTDNYIYGVDSETLSLVQVASDGTLTTLTDPTGYTPAAYNVGDFDSDGHYWVTGSGSGSSTIWYEIDYAAGSPTFGQILDSGTNSSVATGADWVYVGGSLYSISTDTNHLIRFNTTTQTSTDLGALSGVAEGIYGGGYADADGNLYFSNNATGEIYRVDPDAVTAIDLATGPISSLNDGARCADAAIPTVTVQKTVDGRAAATDQFTVGLMNSDGETLTSASTSDTGTTATSTDWPVSRGSTYTITDAMADGSTNTLDAYASTVVCTDTTTGETVTTGGDTAAWTLEIPGQGYYLCNVTNTALDSSYTVSKTVDSAVANPGDTVTYTVTVTNTGTADYTEDSPASFTDDMSGVADDATYNDDASNGATFDGSTLSWSGELAAGASTTITYSFTVNDPDTGDGALANVVLPDGPGGECGEQCTTSTPVQSYTVSKTVDSAVANPGDTVTYTVTVTNTGTADYTEDSPASFTDDMSQVLDDATYGNDAVASDGFTSFSRPELSWSGPLPVGGTVAVTYSVTVNNPDAGDGTLANVVAGDPNTGGTCVTAGDCEVSTAVTPSGPVVATGGTLTPKASVWPWIGAGIVALSALGVLSVRGLRREPGRSLARGDG